MAEIDRAEQRRLEREQRQQQRGQNTSSEAKPKMNFSFDWRILIPIIVLVLAGIEVIVFSSIQPWNYLFAIIIFIASAYMFVQYFNKDKIQSEVFVPKKAYNAAMDEGEKQAVSGVVGKMDLFKGIEQSPSSQTKDSFNLDDFLKSFPEDSSSKPKKRFAEVVEDSSSQPERRVEDKLMQLAKQKEQEKKSSQQEPVRSFQKTETTDDSKTVSFKDLKENTLKELKDLAKKKKKAEEEE